MRLTVAGAPDDTGNLGVTALLFSAVHGLRSAGGDHDFTVLDHGHGRRVAAIPFPDREQPVIRLGATNSRRLYRPEAIARAQWSARLHLPSVLATALRTSDAVVDATGGDSYSDLYGQRRFDAAAAIKRLALDLGCPLVLLPQTYGPFNDPANRAVACRQIRASRIAFARDAASFEALSELRGDGPGGRIALGVDMAFALPVLEPAAFPAWTEEWTDPSTTLVGLNVSGLLANPETASALGVDAAAYAETVSLFATRVLEDERVRILLVPHVLHRAESDVDACEVMAASLRHRRVAMMPPTANPMVAKWWVGQCAFMVGARMHATIAALSSGVAAIATAYSHKFAGVFESAGASDAIVDVRELRDPAAAAARLMSAFERRDVTTSAIMRVRPSVSEALTTQFAAIFDALTTP